MSKINIVQICMHFIEEFTNLKWDKFKEGTIYHILQKFSPQGGYIRRLSSEIMNDSTFIQTRYVQENFFFLNI